MKNIILPSQTLYVISADDLREFFADFMEKRELKCDSQQDELKPLTYFLDKFNIDRSTVFRWEKQKKIKLTRFGRKIYVRECDFVAMKED